MRRSLLWISAGVVTALALALWGVWTWRLSTETHKLALTIEAERQRNFADMVHHTEQLETLLSKGLAAGSTRQNMRYMGDVHYHAQSAVANFTSLPLPAEIGASMGKFLQQTGDFALSLMRNEAAGREMDVETRAGLVRLRNDSRALNGQLQAIATKYNQGHFQWNPTLRLSWSALLGRTAIAPGKPGITQDQAPASMTMGGWEQINQSMGKLPVLLYDGPFSDHIDKRAPAVSGPAVSQEEAKTRMQTYIPDSGRYSALGVTEVNGNLPAYSFRLSPTADGTDYTVTAEITKHGGYLLQMLNSRMAGRATLDLDKARRIGQEYLQRIGYPGLTPTYGQAQDGYATIAYALQQNGIVVYPDQIKVKVALDNGEILAVDTRQYLMSHHARTLGKPMVSPEEAEVAVNPYLVIQRVRLALIPNLAGTGEILTYEFLTASDDETYLVYINANTGLEEQILRQVQTDGGTFAL